MVMILQTRVTYSLSTDHNVNTSFHSTLSELKDMVRKVRGAKKWARPINIVRYEEHVFTDSRPIHRYDYKKREAERINAAHDRMMFQFDQRTSVAIVPKTLKRRHRLRHH